MLAAPPVGVRLGTTWGRPLPAWGCPPPDPVWTGRLRASTACGRTTGVRAPPVGRPRSKKGNRVRAERTARRAGTGVGSSGRRVRRQRLQRSGRGCGSCAYAGSAAKMTS